MENWRRQVQNWAECSAAISGRRGRRSPTPLLVQDWDVSHKKHLFFTAYLLIYNAVLFTLHSPTSTPARYLLSSLWPPARQLRRPICCSLDLLFSPPNLPRSLGRSSPNFATWSMVTHVYKIRSEIRNLDAPPPKFDGPKTSKFRRDFAQIRDLIANISGTQQDIVNRKTSFQTTDTISFNVLMSHFIFSTSLSILQRISF